MSHKTAWIERIERARKRVAEGWTPGILSQDDRGRNVDPRSRSARFFSVGGAMASFGSVRATNEFAFCLEVALGRPSTVVVWEDDPDRTVEHVLSLFDAVLIYERSGIKKDLAPGTPKYRDAVARLKSLFDEAGIVVE